MVFTRRSATHAGSWYIDSPGALSAQLEQWLEQVPDNIDGVGQLPVPGARTIIAPGAAKVAPRSLLYRHAGYSYSGSAAAWAYKALDLSRANRIFVLGPSHHFYLPGCALTKCDAYETPLGDLKIDRATIAELHKTGKFDKMSRQTDEDEHSLEMHLPYIHQILSRSFSGPASFPPLVPILVGSTSATTERTYGQILAPYLADPSSAFIISSDFCHWGTRFNYTYYLPSIAPTVSPSSGHVLRSKGTPDKGGPAIHESIGRLDRMAMDAVESGSHGGFLLNLRETGNTVCGRHPIGVIMAGLETLLGEGDADDAGSTSDANAAEKAPQHLQKGIFRFIRYERSSNCLRVADSSVSYASAFAIV